MGMADGDWAWTVRLSGNYLGTIRKPGLAGLSWQGWSGLVRSDWEGLGLTGQDFEWKKDGPREKAMICLYKTKCVYMKCVVLAFVHARQIH